jgi:hypothetical protein
MKEGTLASHQAILEPTDISLQLRLSKDPDDDAKSILGSAKK